MPSKKDKKLAAINENEKTKREYGTTKRKFHHQDLRNIRPLTDTQHKLFEEYQDGKHLFLYGTAGTGKTFLGLFLAFSEVLDSSTPYDQLIVVRSAVPTREIGFLPGEEEEKLAIYEQPYIAICDELFEYKKSYENLKKSGKIQFLSTSYIRGLTFNRAIILVDEAQNMTEHELDSVITRTGTYTRLIFCGDITQTDLVKNKRDSSGIIQFQKILSLIDEFDLIEFTIDDIVRSDLVKKYIISKQKVILAKEKI